MAVNESVEWPCRPARGPDGPELEDEDDVREQHGTLRLGHSRIFVSEIEAPNMLVNLVQSG